MAVKISFDSITQLFHKMFCHRYLLVGLATTIGIAAGTYHVVTHASEVMVEPIQACVVAREADLTAANRAKFAQCLGWQENRSSPSLCGGSYKPIAITPLSNDEVRIMADDVSFYREGRSELSGNVEVQQAGRVVNAQTAYVYRDAKTNKVSKIELLGEVKYLEAERIMIAKKATINPENKSGKVEDVLYRFNIRKSGAIQPAWGRASIIERFANKDYFLQKATYTTCTPQDNAWQIEADSIKLDDARSIGVARNARLRIRNWPILYTPYLSFPTSRERKSGFLMPVVGSSNVGGFDLALPYYWNIAPNYDATLIPHLYTKRGFMMGGEFRYLTKKSFGNIRARYLPHDRAFNRFLLENRDRYPLLRPKSADRWSVQVQDSTLITRDLHFGLNFSQVSDDYFLQDFSTNLATLTERQMLRQGDLSYTTDHWFFRGMLQSYQTLHPINETPINDSYQRLPQLLANGTYDELPFDSTFSVQGQFDYFRWPGRNLFELPQPGRSSFQPQGSRYHLNPILSLPRSRPWGYLTPSMELVENYYDVNGPASYNYIDQLFYSGQFFYSDRFSHGDQFLRQKSKFNRVIPRYDVDSGLYFERSTSFKNESFTQTLEPRLFYLYVPYHDQTQIPVFDSGYMIFSHDQLFRTNRFSGFDRIGDTNQLSYSLSSRWLSDESGREKAILSIGQARYFAKRRVKLCQSVTGFCEESPETLGVLSLTNKFSPVAARGEYHFNPNWVMAADYVWNPATRSTNNGHVNFHYQPESSNNKIVGVGYTYLVNGDITQVAFTNIKNNPLHQATFAYAWPFSIHWSTLGAYNYNISKRYEMMSFLGVQYDNCCWAVRLIGGRTFQSLDSLSRPRYNNNVFLQILLKGLGSVGNSDPSSRVRTYIPGYNDLFHR
ncbi:organic solvent tolerance protein [Legionella drozanskii LLAP-1]|uniref:LPS-assembly protein LptD n=3 Tax=Legionella TaxID=445 RepID=A0A0W0SQI9_9GAMM|nr:organic solvent tolerance protein [Legionella drozanskii LLAP-1]